MRKSLYAAGLVCLLPALAFAGADTSVSEAAKNRDAAAVRALIVNRADVKAAEADGTTALHWAAYWNDLELVDQLLKAGADPPRGHPPRRDAVVPGRPARLRGDDQPPDRRRCRPERTVPVER